MGRQWRSTATLALLLLCDHWISSDAAPVGKKRSKDDTPGATFFHEGADAMSWDSDDLTKVRNLHAMSFKDKEAYLRSSNLASYLGLTPVEGLHMPVPLNIVFVGFSGDGNMHVNISATELQAWFAHLDHVLPHSRIELAELNCRDGHCSGQVHGHYRPTPVTSFVHLNFSCQVVVVKKKAVVEAFERAIHAFSRPIDPAIELGAQQVDAAKMEAFTSNFLTHLGLESSYSMLVLNPSWTAEEPLYGYRQGFSQPELEHLRDKARIVLTLMAQYENGVEPPLPHPPGGGRWAKANAGNPGKFAVHDAVWSSDSWVAGIEKYLAAEEDHRRILLKAVGKQKGAAAIAQAARVLRQRTTTLASVLLSDLTNEASFASTLQNQYRAMHPAEDCLVSNWVGSGRWLLIDLTSGGFDWGPALGGDGVVHKHTVPSVREHFAGVKGFRTAIRQEVVDTDDHAAESVKALDAFKAERMPAMANRQYHAYTMHRDAAEKAANAPGGSPITDLDEQVWRRQYEETLLQSELDMHEEFAVRRCQGQMEPPLVCSTIKDRVGELRRAIAKMAGSSGSNYEIFRQHKWDIFGAVPEWELTDADMINEVTRSTDLFLADISAVLSRAIRHVVAPPTAVWRHGGYLHDIATPFAKHVHFNIYIISDSSQHMSALHRATFDVDGYKAAVRALKLQHQEFDFTVHHLSLLEDPTLAVAFAAATKTVHQQIISSNVSIEHAERVYVSSPELAYHLQHQFEFAIGRSAPEAWTTPPRNSGGHAGNAAGDVAGVASSPAAVAAAAAAAAEAAASAIKGRRTLEVPLFVFQLERDVALLIDEHYNARALEDMIIVVTNAARQDEHPTGMMCGGALLARPLSPMKEALAATLQYLGGVLPPHLGYNPATHEVMHDWLWSVGAHPLSATSTGTQFTAMQRDALGRAYLLDAIDSSVEALNAGVAALRATPTSPALAPLVQRASPDLRNLLKTYSDMIHLWRSMVAVAGTLDFSAAIEHIEALELDVRKFKSLVAKVTSLTEPLRCRGKTADARARFLVPLYAASSVAAVAAVIFAAWPKVVRKPASKRS